MASFVDEAIETLKQTLNLRLFFYFLVMQLLEAAAELVATIFFAIIGIAAILPLIGEFSPENIQAVFSNQALLFPILAIAMPLAIIWLLILLYIAALFSGARINFFNNFADGKEPSIGKAFSLARKRAFTYFKLDLLVTIIIFAAIAIILAVMLLPLVGLMASNGSMTAIGVFGILGALLLLFLFCVAIFLLSPFLWLFLPVVFFEEKGVIDSINRSVDLARPKYWDNLGFIVIFIAITFVISLLVNGINRAISFAFFFPAISGAETVSEQAVLYSTMGAMPMLSAVFIIIFLPFTVWMSSYSTAAVRNLYFLNLPKSKASPKKKKRIK